VREPPEVLPEAFGHEALHQLARYERLGFLRAGPRLDRAAPAGEVDSMGLLGLFCLWILNYSRRVGNVFSFRFHTYTTGIPH